MSIRASRISRRAKTSPVTCSEQMRQAQNILLYVTPFFLAACSVLPTAEDDGSSLARAESAFAAQSVREDMRSAFLVHFAPDGVFVREAWVNAHQYLAAHPAPPIVLDWRP